MNPVTIDVVISIVSALVAVFSAMVAFYMYKMSKKTLERYDTEIEFLRKQSRSQIFLEMKDALDDTNDKIVEWDLDLTDYDENQNLTPKDKQIIVWIMHQMNICIYSLVQEEIIESEYIDMIRRRCIHNIKKMIESNDKAKSWFFSVNYYMEVDMHTNRFERYFFELVNEIASNYRK